LQALAASKFIITEGTLLLTKLVSPDPAAAARTLAQPLLQLLTPSVAYYLQQQQQQGSATEVVFGVQVTPLQAEQLKITEGHLALLIQATLRGECNLTQPLTCTDVSSN
jgi:hypothetical protein